MVIKVGRWIALVGGEALLAEAALAEPPQSVTTQRPPKACFLLTATPLLPSVRRPARRS